MKPRVQLDDATLRARQALEALAVEYWHEVDVNGGREAHAFYTEDAIFTTSLKSRRGRDEIRAFYTARTARGPRLSLHVVQNFRVVLDTPLVARCDYVMSLYAADGEAVLPSRPAIMIARTTERAVREREDGPWLYAERTLTPLFRDDTPTTG